MYVLTNRANYDMIADALRAKLGTSSAFRPSQMASAIVGIQTVGDLFATGSPVSGSVFGSAAIIVSNAFSSNYRITAAGFPECVEVCDAAFYRCTGLSSAYFPSCAKVGSKAFASTAITAIDLPECLMVGESAFYRCTSLEAASLPKCVSIGARAFYECLTLSELHITGVSAVTALGSSALYGTPIGGHSAFTGTFGSVFVPASLVDAFRAAEGWSSVSSRIFAAE